MKQVLLCSSKAAMQLSKMQKMQKKESHYLRSSPEEINFPARDENEKMMAAVETDCGGSKTISCFSPLAKWLQLFRIGVL